MSTGDPSIIVAVLDEGVAYNHPDLEANMWRNEGEALNVGRDADGNGYTDDLYGYNFVEDTGLITWTGEGDTGHGTHVAGTIAAVNGNGRGVCGIAGGNGTPGSGVKIMSCQVFSGDMSSTLDQEARAIKYAADNGAVILQCSWGYISAAANQASYGTVLGPATEEEWEATYPLEKEALDYFIHNAGSPNGPVEGGVATFAAGNEYASIPSFPGAYSKCVTVGALDAAFTPSSFTNYGEEVDVSAPAATRSTTARSARRTRGVARSGRRAVMGHGSILSTWSHRRSPPTATWTAPRWPAARGGRSGAGALLRRAAAAPLPGRRVHRTAQAVGEDNRRRLPERLQALLTTTTPP